MICLRLREADATENSFPYWHNYYVCANASSYWEWEAGCCATNLPGLENNSAMSPKLIRYINQVNNWLDSVKRDIFNPTLVSKGYHTAILEHWTWTDSFIIDTKMLFLLFGAGKKKKKKEVTHGTGFEPTLQCIPDFMSYALNRAICTYLYFILDTITVCIIHVLFFYQY